ncbi:hypothetical protein CSA80_03030 [Candidatus Saccharibacteria bacterium]|nr:MAG: hypothetical protein CR973_00185 [Candidatus Saccharibacteria bacterium]PID99063.1 MAG: hypothetical protein CSA80_03030 [Candidatus Saccharibacteria bacterium]
MTKIKDTYKDDRPREKLIKFGSEKLSDLELLMAIIGSGNSQADVGQISRQVLKVIRAKNGDLNYQDLRQIKGLGEAKASVILANLELAKRYLLEDDRPVIDSSDAAVAQLSDIRNKQQEHFVCLTLDGANRLIAKRTITIGTLNSSLVHPREVFADAITDRAASIIVAHNHPSGSLRPSEADKQVTKKLADSAEILGIKLIDHIIVTKDEHRSIL